MKFKSLLIIFTLLSSQALSKEIKNQSHDAKNIQVKLIFKSRNLTKDEKEVIALAEKSREHLEGQRWSESQAISHNLDNKGRAEVFYSGPSNFDCGSAGCIMFLYQYKNQKWQIIQKFQTMGDIFILNNKTNDYFDISMPLKYKNDKEIMDWQNFTLHWNGKYYCSAQFKNC